MEKYGLVAFPQMRLRFPLNREGNIREWQMAISYGVMRVCLYRSHASQNGGGGEIPDTISFMLAVLNKGSVPGL